MSLSLSGNTPATTFNKLLIINNSDLSSTSGLDDSLRLITDGSGLSSPLSMSVSSIAFNNMTWPATGNVPGSFLQVSSDTTKLQWYTLASGDISAALGYVPANVNDGEFVGAVNIKGAVYDTVTTHISGTAAVPIYTFNSSKGGTLKLMCQIVDSSTNAIQSEEILVVTDSSVADMTSYGMVVTQQPLGVFDVSMNGSNVDITFQAASDTSKISTVVVTYITKASS